MRVLVGYASKYGATDELAHEIARVLGELDLDVTVSQLNEARGEYDAYVMGSAVYAGHWLKSARQFIKAHHAKLLNSRVWLFSSGPVGRPLKPDGDPQDVTTLLESIRPEGHAVFAGKLQKERLNLVEKVVVSAVKVPEGDFRDWEAVRHWALSIGEALTNRAGTESAQA